MDPPLCSSRTCLHMAFIAFSVPILSNWRDKVPLCCGVGMKQQILSYRTPCVTGDRSLLINVLQDCNTSNPVLKFALSLLARHPMILTTVSPLLATGHLLWWSSN